jgi:molecular chaperone HtpG
MTEENYPDLQNPSQPIAFQTEVKQLLNILIHSLYTRREIFLRELISNASDALTQMRFVQQTEREYRGPELDFEIRIEVDQEENILKVTDTGVGMTREEVRQNLGTIAQSGARAFLEAVQDQSVEAADVIGKFGVGFYSVFMAADWVKVTSLSYQPDAEPVSWFATGADTFRIGAAEKAHRGTAIEIKLKEDAEEFARESRLREIIRKHSNYVAYPVYVGDEQEQVNEGSAIWRESPQAVEQEQYQDYYQHLTLDFQPPLETIHFVADAPLKIYALLYIPGQVDQNLFNLREQDGLKLYARKVLIDEYATDLLPQYYRFVQGVVDAEDLPLNVSRESVQASAVMARIQRILANQVTQKLKAMAQKDPEQYEQFWEQFGAFIKEGVAADDAKREELYPLLRFRSNNCPEIWSSLDDYLERMKPGQEKIYYILGDDPRSISRSPHLDYFHTHGYEVLTLTEPVDSFLVIGLSEYQGHPLQNVSASDLELPTPESEQEESGKEAEAEQEERLGGQEMERLIGKFKQVLGEQVADVRPTERLTTSLARLVDAEGSPGQEIQRVYRMMDREFEIPKKVLELNPRHPVILKLSQSVQDGELTDLVINQVFDSMLLIEGIHPDPPAMIPRIQALMEYALQED